MCHLVSAVDLSSALPVRVPPAAIPMDLRVEQTQALKHKAAAAADPLRRVPVEAPAALAPARGPVTGAHEGQDPALVGCSGSQPSHVCECERECVCVSV